MYNIHLTEAKVRKYGERLNNVSKLKKQTDRSGIRRLGNIYFGEGQYYPYWSTLYYVNIDR